LKLIPKDLRNELLSKGNYEKTALREAEERGRVEMLEKLWNWDVNFHLKPEELRHMLLF
jgi:hypothetical protein